MIVRCHGCGRRRELTQRSARRAGLCSLCRYPQHVTPTVEDREWWLERFTDGEIAAIATEFVGWFVHPSIVATHRARMNGQRRAA